MINLSLDFWETKTFTTKKIIFDAIKDRWLK
jgi:hypothetical protein